MKQQANKVRKIDTKKLRGKPRETYQWGSIELWQKLCNICGYCDKDKRKGEDDDVSDGIHQYQLLYNIRKQNVVQQQFPNLCPMNAIYTRTKILTFEQRDDRCNYIRISSIKQRDDDNKKYIH